MLDFDRYFALAHLYVEEFFEFQVSEMKAERLKNL